MLILVFSMLFSTIACMTPAAAETAESSEQPSTQAPIHFFDDGLSRFEVWMGPVHPSVKGMPEGTPRHQNMKQGTPLGLGKDHKDTFSMIEEDGQPVLKITGEIYGGLTTLESFADYHLSVEFKWGKKKWEPRLTRKRDSGLLYHCHGEHGQFANTWKACLEYQVQERDLGDYIGLSGPKAKVRVSPVADNSKQLKYDPRSETVKLLHRYTYASSEPNRPNGQWNKLDLYVVGDRAVHVVNDVVVFALFDAIDKQGKRLDRGQIQIQSEGAECYYRGMVLTPMDVAEVPEEVAELLKNP